MNRFSPDDVSEEQLDHFIEWLAAEVHKRGLESPLLFFLEAHKPLGNLFTHLLMAFSPLMLTFVGPENTNIFLHMLSKREHVEKLQSKIEQISSSGSK